MPKQCFVVGMNLIEDNGRLHDGREAKNWLSCVGHQTEH